MSQSTRDSASPFEERELHKTDLEESQRGDNHHGQADSDKTAKRPPNRRGTMTTHACISCREKRTKCDGKKPCDRCRRRDVECRYVGKPWQSKGCLRQETEELRRHLRQREMVLQALAFQPNPQDIVQRLRNGDSVEEICHSLGSQLGRESAGHSNQPEPAVHPRLFDEAGRARQHEQQMPTGSTGYPDDFFGQDRAAGFTPTETLLEDSPSTASSYSTGSAWQVAGTHGIQAGEKGEPVEAMSVPKMMPQDGSPFQHTVDYSRTCEWPPCTATTRCSKHLQYQSSVEPMYPMNWPCAGDAGYEDMPPM
ncbi:Conidial development protein fluffy [Cladobotryum mycophilum]|uniref:Conidial development protein fluffy n=1 Tax=Cladobotryum mycophilum TaxID=491253 RepID=A0ABR0T2B7_9HYPO